MSQMTLRGCKFCALFSDEAMPLTQVVISYEILSSNDKDLYIPVCLSQL